MRAVLGIDAAWTEGEPSGVCLVEGEGDSWRVVCAAPSYESFLGASRGTPIDWQMPRFPGVNPDLPRLMDAARKMTTATIGTVAIDMPLARTPISSRRVADSEISRIFGSRGCSTHSPSPVRPGPLGASINAQLLAEGFPLATTNCAGRNSPCTVEVYPHPALLTLLGRDYRVPYKVSRSSKYWPGASVPERIARLLDQFEEINAGLGAELGGSPVRLPAASDVPTLSVLKRYEDTLDSVICAWVGLKFAQDAATPYGDETAAIWVP
jgi:predicted RNase H-like nuclease